MMNALRITVFALIAMTAGLLASNEAEAVLDTHNCTFCHSLHGSTSTSSFVPLNSPTNIEVLCLGCHLTANGATDPVQPHRFASGDTTVDALYITCTDCHNIHDNMPNWRQGHTDSGNTGDPPPVGWIEGTNAKMVGREDPDGTTPYAIIITKEIDRDKDGLPDRDAPVPVNCDGTVVNDCYMTGKRHVIFENPEPNSQTGGSGLTIHAYADDNEDGVDDTSTIGVNANLTNNSGADASPWDSICQMCHMETGNHTGWVGGGGNNGHNAGKRCTDGCHRHDYCFDKGNDCSKWSVPNRNLQVDTVSAAPASVNAGQTVTITVDVTNLGDNIESIEVRYTSDIEGPLGWSTVADVASSGSGQTFLDWITVDAGAHTVTADIVPVIGETVIANNSGTDIVTVTGSDLHDVAVTSVAAPDPIQQGATETVSVDLENLGTFTEGPFNVTLSSDLDGTVQTLPSGSLTPGATPTLNFSWNTTGATLGSHTLTATSALADDVPGNDSANTATVVAIHDVAVTNVTAPPSVDQGTSASVNVDIANLSSSGGFTETFNVTLYDNTDDPGHASPIQVLSSGALAAGGTDTLNFSWDTSVGPASIATHTLEAIADTVAGETITANNTDTTTSDVIAPVTHDVAVDLVTAPATVDRGTSPTVSVDISNNGGASETFDVTLVSDLDGTIQVLSSGVLAAGNSTTLNFTWATGPATSLGTHTLTATADTVPSETNTSDNSANTASDVTSHDVAVDLVTAPASTVQGNVAAVDVDVTNEGTFTETFNVTLVSDLNGTIQTLSSGALGAGASTTLNFSWNTTGADIATHTLTATADTVSGETDTADNSANTTSDVTTPPVHDVAVDSVTAPASTSQGTTVQVDVDISNPGGFTENIDVTLVSDLDGTIQTINTGTLGASGSTTLNFSWNTTGATTGTHTLTATWTHDGGDGGTDNTAGNNSANTTADVTAGATNDLAVTSITFSPASPINTCGSRSSVDVIVRITNEGTATESSFFVQLNSDGLDVGNFPDQQVTSLAAGTFADRTFNWNHGRNDECGTINFTATVDVVPGETDTADNSLVEPVTIQ